MNEQQKQFLISINRFKDKNGYPTIDFFKQIEPIRSGIFYIVDKGINEECFINDIEMRVDSLGIVVKNDISAFIKALFTRFNMLIRDDILSLIYIDGHCLRDTYDRIRSNVGNSIMNDISNEKGIVSIYKIPGNSFKLKIFVDSYNIRYDLIKKYRNKWLVFYINIFDDIYE